MFTHYDKMGSTFRLGQTNPRTDKLPPGIYRGYIDPFGGRNFKPMTFAHDGILKLDEGVAQKVIHEVDQFLKSEVRSRFERYNLLYKRGILLYGPPGTGKTVILEQIAEGFVAAGGTVLFNPEIGDVAGLVEGVREVEPDRQFMIIFEELDGKIRHQEASLLELLDGEVQIDNVVYLASTNYLEQIPDRLKNRPSRFASIIRVGTPSAVSRMSYLKQRVMKEDHATFPFDKVVEQTEHLTIDHLKDVIISITCFGVSPEEAIKKAHMMCGLKSLGNDDDL